MHCLNTAVLKILPLLSSLCEMKFLSMKPRGRRGARERENKQELRDSNPAKQNTYTKRRKQEYFRAHVQGERSCCTAV